MVSERINYLFWAARHWSPKSPDCPFCQTSNTQLIKRKFLVTALYRCLGCGLLFRVPKDDPQTAREFYQEAYQQGFTTDCPTDEKLKTLINTGFKGTEKDYSIYIDVL